MIVANALLVVNVLSAIVVAKQLKTSRANIVIAAIPVAVVQSVMTFIVTILQVAVMITMVDVIIVPIIASVVSLREI
jgi:hypothetical protein